MSKIDLFLTLQLQGTLRISKGQLISKWLDSSQKNKQKNSTYIPTTYNTSGFIVFVHFSEELKTSIWFTSREGSIRKALGSQFLPR